MKILPVVSSGVVLMHEDGTFEMAPLQVFRTDKGQTVVRFGNNTLWFDENGKFDGTECRLPPERSVEEVEEVRVACEKQGQNKGQAPAEAYFQEGSPAWKREVADWPKKPVSN